MHTLLVAAHRLFKGEFRIADGTGVGIFRLLHVHMCKVYFEGALGSKPFGANVAHARVEVFMHKANMVVEVGATLESFTALLADKCPDFVLLLLGQMNQYVRLEQATMEERFGTVRTRKSASLVRILVPLYMRLQLVAVTRHFPTLRTLELARGQVQLDVIQQSDASLQATIAAIHLGPFLVVRVPHVLLVALVLLVVDVGAIWAREIVEMINFAGLLLIQGQLFRGEFTQSFSFLATRSTVTGHVCGHLSSVSFQVIEQNFLAGDAYMATINDGILVWMARRHVLLKGVKVVEGELVSAQLAIEFINFLDLDRVLAADKHLNVLGTNISLGRPVSRVGTTAKATQHNGFS